MMKSNVVFWLAVLILFVGATVVWVSVRGLTHAAVKSGQDDIVDFGPPLDEFELTQSTGEKFASHSLVGSVWVANFFYSTCPSVCVQENMKMQQLAGEYGDRGVKFVSITCDAAIDTPSRLPDYSLRFNAKTDRWVFLTGKQDYIDKVGNDIFKVPMSYRYHSERLFVVDRHGKMRGAFEFKYPAEMQKLRKKIDDLLAETPPTPEDGNGVVAGATASVSPNHRRGFLMSTYVFTSEQSR